MSQSDNPQKKQPMRRCIGCGKSDLKRNLLRVVCSDGCLLLDEKHKIQTRGAYVHESERCLMKVQNFFVWGRSLRLSTEDIPDKKLPLRLLVKKSGTTGGKKNIRL